MNSIINCTPHAIRVLDEDNNTVLFLPKGEIISRLSTSTERVGKLFGAAITKTVFGDVEDLPEEIPGTVLVVSRLVMSACPNRHDLLVPNELVRDGEGNIIGCKSLSHN